MLIIIHFILMGIRILILHPPWKKMNPDPGPGVMNISLKFAGFLKQKKNFQNIFLLFMIFIPAITEHFHNLSKFSSSDFGAGSKLFLLQVWVDILHQNAEDPTDPKRHVVFLIFLVKIFFHFSFLLISLNTHHRKPFR